MTHKQVLFRSAAREKVLRGATQLADAVRVTLGPKSKSVLIQKKLGAAARLQRRRHHRQGVRPQGSRGEPRRADAAPGRGEDRRRGRRRHQHLDDPRPRDLRRRRAQRRGRRQRHRSQARARPRRYAARSRRCSAMSRPVRDAQGEGAGRDHLRAQRPADRRAGRRRHGEGRRRGRDHGRGIQDHRDRRSRWSRACSSTAAIISPYFITDPEKMEAVLEDALILLTRPQDQRCSRTCSRCSSRSPRPGSPLLVIAEDVEGEALATLVVNQIRGVLKMRRREGARASATGARRCWRTSPC